MLLAQDGWVLTDTQSRTIIAVVAVIIGFVLKEVADQIRDRKKVKRLTYSMSVGSTLADVPETLVQKVSVEFEGRPVEGQLYEVTCSIENAGHLVVKNEYLRFSFPERSQILDAYILGDPPPEYGIEDAPLPNQAPIDKRWVVAHLERRQTASFGFLVAGPVSTAPKLFGHNEAGDVELNPAGRNVDRDDVSHVRPLMTYALLSVLIPAAPFEFSRVVTSVVQLLLLILTIPHLYPVGRVLAAFLARPDEKPRTRADVMIYNSEIRAGNIGGGSNQGLLTQHSTPDEQEPTA
ncbi:hypothetical protein VMT65_12125 [Nocardia sp. CDC153]|uniref:hypothetical protein n=1 Tax=Nocardia sp. CDC153 TaxID=3112167 RepID=UPI002DB8FBB4|nr:hypothetical protein [Nocardia sp. CDC153]MEC3953777.1 hypothetical protein [Nocardia sp. CDC153]